MEKELLPHQQRVVEEKNELNEKLEKLRSFLDSDIYKTLDSVDKVDLKMQYNAMITYYHVLSRRILRFHEDKIKATTVGNAYYTLGERRVMNTFNPSENEKVSSLKAIFSYAIDMIESNKTDNNIRESSIAQTEAETACMYAVKSVFIQ